MVKKTKRKFVVFCKVGDIELRVPVTNLDRDRETILRAARIRIGFLLGQAFIKASVDWKLLLTESIGDEETESIGDDVSEEEE
jgi:hypothetical protein